MMNGHIIIRPFGRGLCDKCGLPEDKLTDPVCFVQGRTADFEPGRQRRDKRDDRVFTDR